MMLEKYPWLEPTYKFLVDSFHAQKAHHAYLLVYHGQIGQDTLMELFARFLLCQENEHLDYPCNKCRACQAYNLQSNSDFYNLTADKKSHNISIDNVRTVIERVELEPAISAKNVVLIDDASKFNINSANAILKTLEEPPSKTHFIIGLSAGFNVLPTIRSRCMVVNVNAPTEQQIHDFLTQADITEPDRSYLMALAPEQPELMLSMQKKGYIPIFQQTIQALANLLDNLELADFVEVFNTNDLEVFTWQIEAISNILTLAGRRFFTGEDNTLELLEVLAFDQGADSKPLSQVLTFFKDILTDKEIAEDLYDLVEKIMVVNSQLIHFPQQLAPENSLKGIAYKVGALIALYIYNLNREQSMQAFMDFTIGQN
ncbi:hypothetical protein [Psittacicella hinzii]|uniref:DNA-directed DNA polymerase n=1 Tax=Psittacicella hinzii TaxID=2028575 RepID=A0A3A1YLV9_9GAMM|nr:hypothetical protein [Psittacicella hinzii]RIY38541.1 hypothetical protein CKF58_04040 [Psittacicella hinzii]